MIRFAAAILCATLGLAGAADVPNPFATACGPARDAICWASDHTGTQADVHCP
jgi:hypothetical protein